MQVSVGLDEPEAVGEEAGRLVVVEGVTAQGIAPFDEQDIGQPEGQGETADDRQPSRETPSGNAATLLANGRIGWVHRWLAGGFTRRGQPGHGGSPRGSPVPR